MLAMQASTGDGWTKDARPKQAEEPSPRADGVSWIVLGKAKCIDTFSKSAAFTEKCGLLPSLVLLCSSVRIRVAPDSLG